MTKKVVPLCKLEAHRSWTFIEYDGLVTPCCWMITSKQRYQALKEFMGEDFDKLFIDNDPSEIAALYGKIERSWDTDQPFKTCLKQCGKDV